MKRHADLYEAIGVALDAPIGTLSRYLDICIATRNWSHAAVCRSLIEHKLWLAYDRKERAANKKERNQDGDRNIFS